MKKFILLLAFAVTSIICYSQNFNKVYRASYIKYEGGRWVDDVTKYPENMFVILNGSEVKITNESESKYITYGNPKISKYETYNCSSWSAYDQKGRDCEMIMKYFYEQKIMVVMFMYYSDNVGFEYEIVADK